MRFLVRIPGSLLRRTTRTTGHEQAEGILWGGMRLQSEKCCSTSQVSNALGPQNGRLDEKFASVRLCWDLKLTLPSSRKYILPYATGSAASEVFRVTELALPLQGSSWRRRARAAGPPSSASRRRTASRTACRPLARRTPSPVCGSPPFPARASLARGRECAALRRFRASAVSHLCRLSFSTAEFPLTYPTSHSGSNPGGGNPLPQMFGQMAFPGAGIASVPDDDVTWGSDVVEVDPKSPRSLPRCVWCSLCRCRLTRKLGKGLVVICDPFGRWPRGAFLRQ